jgi:hypothetical protein
MVIFQYLLGSHGTETEQDALGELLAGTTPTSLTVPSIGRRQVLDLKLAVASDI